MTGSILGFSTSEVIASAAFQASNGSLVPQSPRKAALTVISIVTLSWLMRLSKLRLKARQSKQQSTVSSPRSLAESKALCRSVGFLEPAAGMPISGSGSMDSRTC